MLNSSISAFEEITTPIGNSIYEGNITQSGDWDLTNGENSNQTVTTDLLSSGTDFYNITAGSPAINSGIGTYRYLTTDITGGSRSTNFDAGAEEFNSMGSNLPYKLTDVGVKLGFGADQSLSLIELDINKELKIYPNPVEDNYFTISLENKIIGLVELIDSLGRIVQENYIAKSKGKININKLPKGVYIVKVNNSFKRMLIN